LKELSIITVNYNNATGLERTIKSVQEQTTQDFEHIIIDGNSDDGSKELIERTKDNYSYAISEPDQGVYDAMNKGIAQATGNYILFLNSGDTLYKNYIISKVQSYLDNSTAIVYGDLSIIGEDRPDFIHHYPKKLDFNFFKNTSLGHPATFIKKELFDLYGNYRTDLNIASDWEFFLKTICIEKESYKKMNVIVSNFYEGGLSTTALNIENHKAEVKKVLLEHYEVYDAHFNELLAIKQENDTLYTSVNPHIKVVTTNAFFLKILNSFIGLFAFIIKKKRA
jgi:glycosyltransferase involved in cell wall biosynthesis